MWCLNLVSSRERGRHRLTGRLACCTPCAGLAWPPPASHEAPRSCVWELGTSQKEEQERDSGRRWEEAGEHTPQSQ